MLAAMTLAGCSPKAPDPEPTRSVTPPPTAPPEPTTTPEPPITATPTPTPPPAPLPDCESMLSAAQLNDMFDPEGRIQAMHELPGIRAYVLEHEIGPVALATLDAARDRRDCSWGMPNSDAVIHIFVSRLDAAAKSTLMTALDDSIFGHSTEGDVTVYTNSSSIGVASINKTYLFSGDLWVAELSSLTEGLAGRTLLQGIAP